MKKIAMFSIYCMLTSPFMFCQQEDLSRVKILPLHPYSASPTDYDSTERKSTTFVAKFYFIHGVDKSTDELSVKLDSFLINSLENDVDFETYGSYVVFFFKESGQTNRDYRDKGTDDTPDSHMKDDLLFRYQWTRKHFEGCRFYRNGETVKKIVSKKGKFFT